MNMTIIDIELLREINMKELDDVTNNIIENDIHPKIETEVIEDNEKIYTLNERVEDLLSILLSSFDAYNKKYLIQNIYEIVRDIKIIFENNDFNILRNIDMNKFKEISICKK